MPEREALASYLQVFRMTNGENQTECAKEIGISRAEVSLIEREQADPRFSTLKKAAEHIGIPISELLRVEKNIRHIYKEADPIGTFPELAALAWRVRRFRNTHKESQEAFAYNAGISIASLSMIEREIANPRLSALQKIAAYMGVPVSDLIDPIHPNPNQSDAEKDS